MKISYTKHTIVVISVKMRFYAILGIYLNLSRNDITLLVNFGVLTSMFPNIR